MTKGCGKIPAPSMGTKRFWGEFVIGFVAMTFVLSAFATNPIVSGNFNSDTSYFDEDEESASWVEFPDGNGLVYLRANTTFSNGHVVMQCREGNGLAAFDIPGGDWAADVAEPFFLGAGAWCRLQMTGSIDPDVDWELRPRVVRTENYQWQGTDTVDGQDQLPGDPTNVIESGAGTSHSGSTPIGSGNQTHVIQ